MGRETLVARDEDVAPRSPAPLGMVIVAAGLLGLVAGSAVTGVSVSPFTWYLARASGFTLYLLLWLSVVAGVGLTTRLLDSIAGRGSLWQVHRASTELAFVMLALHMTSLAIDPSVRLGLAGVLVHFATHVREPWTGLGILAAMGMIGIGLSFWIRRLLRHRGWRLLHYGAFPLWLLALAHGIGVGSDTIRPWAALPYLGTAGVVVYLTGCRALRAGRRADPPVPPRRPGVGRVRVSQ